MSELDANLFERAIIAGEVASREMFTMLAGLLLLETKEFTGEAAEAEQLCEQFDALLLRVKEKARNKNANRPTSS